MKVTRLNENLSVMEPIVEEVDTTTDRFVTAMADYRKYANLDESVALTEDMIDEWALNEAACKNACTTVDLKDRLLEADDMTIDAAAKKLEADTVKAMTENQITKALDRALRSAKTIQKEELETGEPTDGEYPNILLVGQAGTAKAQPLTSKVYTPTGYKLMGDIKVGDEVLDGKGRRTTVLGVYPQGKHDIYRIYFDDKTFIEVADNHLNSVYKYTYPHGKCNHETIREDYVVETTLLKEWVDKRNHSKNHNESHYFVECPTVYDWENDKLPIEPYMLGCLIGDGCLGQSSGISFTTIDREIFEAVNNVLVEDWNTELVPMSKTNEKDFRIANLKNNKHSQTIGLSELREALEDLHLNVNSEYKHIPDCYLFSSYENRVALFQGLMDTDGTIEKIHTNKKSGNLVGGKCSFCSVSKQLVEDVAFLARSLGCKVTISECSAKTYVYKYKGTIETHPCKQSYKLYIVIPEELDAFRLERKACNKLVNRFEIRRKIESIEFNRVDECQCIYVESDEHTYITDNLTLTHNTSVVKQWAKANGINLVYKDAKTMDPSALGGIVARDMGDTDYARRLGTKEFQTLDAPNSVLFLDEYNRAKSEIRGSLLTLVQDHVVWDPKSKGEMRHLPNFLFTVAAINPSGNIYKGAKEMDPAERSRFRRINIQMDPAEHLKFLEKHYTERLAKATDEEEKLAIQGRLELARALLTSPKFAYDTIIDEDENFEDDAYIPLNYRSLKKALDDCDGTKKDLIDIWSEYCNYKKKNIIVDILSKFVDVKDKANDALKTETKSTVFNRAETNREKLRKLGLNV